MQSGLLVISMSKKKVKLMAFLLATAISSMASSCAAQPEGCPEEKILANKTVKDQLACIYDLVEHDTILVPDLLFSESVQYTAALVSLKESGYLVPVKPLAPAPEGLPTWGQPVQGYYPTAEGAEYLYKHKYPARFWLQQNWFPLAIAIVNALIGIGTILVGWRCGRNRAGRNQRRQSARNS